MYFTLNSNNINDLINNSPHANILNLPARCTGRHLVFNRNDNNTLSDIVFPAGFLCTF